MKVLGVMRDEEGNNRLYWRKKEGYCLHCVGLQWSYGVSFYLHQRSYSFGLLIIFLVRRFKIFQTDFIDIGRKLDHSPKKALCCFVFFAVDTSTVWSFINYFVCL